MGWESSDVARFNLGSLFQGKMGKAKLKLVYNSLIIVSPDERRGYLGFSMVTPPPPCRNLTLKLFTEGHPQTAKVPHRSHFLGGGKMFVRAVSQKP